MMMMMMLMMMVMSNIFWREQQDKYKSMRIKNIGKYKARKEKMKEVKS